VPDDSDYEWLGWLLVHPEKWTNEDLSAVRFMIVNQRRAVEDTHPKDEKGRRSAQAVVDEQEAALRKHVAGRD
jgi:hypothetical protein